MARNLKNLKNEKYRSWNMARKLKNVEIQKHIRYDMKYVKKQ
jgi:hypothetical protein